MSFTCLKCDSTNLDASEIESLICQHIFCLSCICSHVISNLNPKIKCPLSTCNNNINDNIIRMVLPENKIEEYEQLCLESVAKVQNNSFKCLFPECANIVFYDRKEVIFECTFCKLHNCVMCNATHPYLSCKEYQAKSKSAVNNLADRNELKDMKKEEFAKAKIELNDIKRKKLLKTCELMDSLNLIPNDEIFSCTTCLKIYRKDVGIKLRNCYHMFCKDCLRGTIVNSVLPVLCPEGSCKARLEDREIRGILNDKEYERHYEKCMTQAKSQLDNVFHCKKPNCSYYGILENPRIKNFICPICKSTNCVSCATIHKNNETCAQYLKNKSCDHKTNELIQKEIKQGKCMICPKCGSLIKKNGGCNWIQCPFCKLELCWVLKMPRWGPKGKGDTSGGCKCLVDNKKCHETCLYGCIPE